MAAEDGLIVENSIKVLTQNGVCQIDLCLGDITKLKKEDSVDVLVVSAFRGESCGMMYTLSLWLSRLIHYDFKLENNHSIHQWWGLYVHADRCLTMCIRGYLDWDTWIKPKHASNSINHHWSDLSIIRSKRFMNYCMQNKKLKKLNKWINYCLKPTLVYR